MPTCACRPAHGVALARPGSARGHMHNVRKAKTGSKREPESRQVTRGLIRLYPYMSRVKARNSRAWSICLLRTAVDIGGPGARSSRALRPVKQADSREPRMSISVCYFIHHLSVSGEVIISVRGQRTAGIETRQESHVDYYSDSTRCLIVSFLRRQSSTC